MDIALLSKMLLRLLQDHDSVSLPGLGAFVVKQEPAWFSDKGYTINPPAKRLSFVASEEDDGLLVDYYAASNGIERAVAEDYIRRFACEMLEVLKRKKTLALEGLGRLRATRENAVFFVADPDLNLESESIPLRSVSLKSLVNEESVEISVPLRRPEPAVETAPEPAAETETVAEETETVPEETDAVPEGKETVTAATDAVPEETDAVAEEKEAVAEAPEVVEEEPAVKEESAAVEEEPAAEVETVSEEQGGQRKGRKKISKAWYIIPIVLVCLAIVCLAVFLVLCDVAPDFVDSLLYTPEELKIINY